MDEQKLYDIVYMAVRDAIQAIPISEEEDDELITCRECGRRYRQITARHLSTHGISVEEYKKKWRLPIQAGLCSRSVSRLRGEKSRQSGNYQRGLEALKARWNGGETWDEV